MTLRSASLAGRGEVVGRAGVPVFGRTPDAHCRATESTACASVASQNARGWPLELCDCGAASGATQPALARDPPCDASRRTDGATALSFLPSLTTLHAWDCTHLGFLPALVQLRTLDLRMHDTVQQSAKGSNPLQAIANFAVCCVCWCRPSRSPAFVVMGRRFGWFGPENSPNHKPSLKEKLVKLAIAAALGAATGGASNLALGGTFLAGAGAGAAASGGATLANQSRGKDQTTVSVSVPLGPDMRPGRIGAPGPMLPPTPPAHTSKPASSGSSVSAASRVRG